MPSIFGELEGFPLGTQFGSRADVRDAGLHRHLMGGISGNPSQGADAIVVSGGYDDDDDQGNSILYTGEGGQDAPGGTQVADQVLAKGNLALVRSYEDGLPVRVIRGAKGDPKYSPTTGYRYDGLYRVATYSYEPSSAGPRVFKFHLVKDHDEAPWTLPPDPAAHVGTDKPCRTASTVQRLVRNSAVTQAVKGWHDHCCQVCGLRLEGSSGPYAEGAHIRPLGRPHDGPDTVSNVLCLCPNHHVEFDLGAIYVDDDRKVIRASTSEPQGDLRTAAAHSISDTHFAYHREHIASATT